MILKRFNYWFFRNGWISFTVLSVSMIFCFVIFPLLLEHGFTLILDVDDYGKLGKGLYYCHSLSFYPSCEPSVLRAPLYPTLFALVYAINPAFYPISIQLTNCILLALTCEFVFYIAYSFATLKLSQIIALISGLHPFLIWYSSRVYIEPLITFLFALLVLQLLQLSKKSSLWSSCKIGILLGFLSLTKQTFLPFIVLIPVGIYLLQLSYRQALFILIISSLIILPWTFRNWRLTHHFIPIQLLVGYNMQIGDSLIESPYIEEWWQRGYQQKIKPLENASKTIFGIENSSWQQEIYVENEALKTSLQSYYQDPFFFLRKVIFNAWAFWFIPISNNINIYTHPFLYFIFLAMQGSLLFLFLLASWIVFFKLKKTSIHRLVMSMVWLYFLFYLPVLSISRFCFPLIPIIIIYGLGWPTLLRKND